MSEHRYTAPELARMLDRPLTVVQRTLAKYDIGVWGANHTRLVTLEEYEQARARLKPRKRPWATQNPAQ